jgi:hypothetical protein
MAEIVSLRQARKRKARADKERVAEQNRALRGRGKAEKIRDADAAKKSQNFLEGHRRESPAGDGEA